MKRQIKFRAFVPGEGMMSTAQLLEAGINPMMDKVKVNNKEIIFMQYTGLKDKNGVPIYEGDLLHRHLGVKWKVVFKNSTWIADGNDSGLYLSSNQFNECEVIGNIHEK